MSISPDLYMEGMKGTSTTPKLYTKIHYYINSNLYIERNQSTFTDMYFFQNEPQLGGPTQNTFISIVTMVTLHLVHL